MFGVMCGESNSVVVFDINEHGQPVPVGMMSQEEFEARVRAASDVHGFTGDVLIIPMERGVCVSNVRRVRDPGDTKTRLTSVIDYVYSVHNVNDLETRTRFLENLRQSGSHNHALTVHLRSLQHLG